MLTCHMSMYPCARISTLAQLDDGEVGQPGGTVIGLNYVGHDYLSHNYIGSNYVGHKYVGRDT